MSITIKSPFYGQCFVNKLATFFIAKECEFLFLSVTTTAALAHNLLAHLHNHDLLAGLSDYNKRKSKSFWENRVFNFF